ncbi:MAG: M48 family metallopeptidase [Acidiferrobacterales bacterium]|nr:M48 family metallopeptidase [Acidiferrobacterales bacterium]
MQNQVFKVLLLLPLLIIATGCATATKNFEPGVLPEYATVSEEKLQENRVTLQRIMGGSDLELKTSGPAYSKVSKIMNRLSRAADIRQELEIYTVDAGEQVNAFALGGNTIVVYDELVRRLPVEEELAVVLAHETAHILGQHNADDTVQKRSAGVGLAASLFGTAISIATGNSGLGSIAADSTSAIGTGVVLSYGRAMEHEADHIGMLLMAKAGYDPAVAITVWEKADEVLGGGGGPSFFSSHPSHGNRLQRLRDDYRYALPYYKQSGAG